MAKSSGGKRYFGSKLGRNKTISIGPSTRATTPPGYGKQDVGKFAGKK